MTQAAPIAVMSRDLMRVCAGDDDSDDDEERPMSRDELKAKTLRGMSKRCGPLSAMRTMPRFGSFLFTMFEGMALGLQQPKARGGRTSRVGDSNCGNSRPCVLLRDVLWRRCISDELQSCNKIIQTVWRVVHKRSEASGKPRSVCSR